MQASVAEEGSPVGMLNLAFMLQHSLGYNASDRHTPDFCMLMQTKAHPVLRLQGCNGEHWLCKPVLQRRAAPLEC